MTQLKIFLRIDVIVLYSSKFTLECTGKCHVLVGPLFLKLLITINYGQLAS